MVSTAEQARAVVRASKFPPIGERGQGSVFAFYGHGLSSVNDYVKSANDTILTIIQVETVAGVENIDEICQTRRIDVIFIGPNDLAQALLGYFPAKGTEPAFVEAVDKIIASAKKHGKKLAITAMDGESTKKATERFDLIVKSGDVKAMNACLLITALIDLQALGVKMVTSNEIIMLAKAADYDSVFIDQEHSVFSLEDVSRLCSVSLLAGITPFVRVPWQCGSGHVLRVLDGGAMGIIFPHISTVEEAKQAVACTKYPPRGNRSLTAALPQFAFQRTDANTVMRQLDSIGSTVLILVETKACLQDIDAIAAVDGVDVLLFGANDLMLEFGVGRDWQIFHDALCAVSEAAHRTGKIFGIAGMYTRPDICKRAVLELGARYVVGHFDLGLLSMGMNNNIKQLKDMEQK
ncbi:hypothetical protein SCUCBS95973_009142 [Sporothrix curviconia]|uniref:HpcH/HpaI aldolase/citrate lyase domain-containing protein n=1 Tax=Sporothrix curviconia TaxID=1260050 RepID=A0ABP0CSH0_9PEZI